MDNKLTFSNETNNFSELYKLFTIFPPDIQQFLQNHEKKNEVLEIILDLGKRAEARFLGTTEYISKRNVSWQDLDYSVRRIGKFNDDNRTGIEKTLHRISCICNREGLIIGLTCRVGRSISGPISIIRDYLKEKKSFLILGKPGVGKTTIIREMARILSDELNRRVVIIDTSNEIAGASNIPHSSLGRARRMQVKKSKLQHDIMLEAVENHMPEVIIIDEISTELEVLAARTIAERGVQLIGTVHGTALKSLAQNPILVELIGGLQYVTLSDDEAKRRGSQKSIIERKTYSSFEIAIEILERNFWTIHPEVEKSVDLILKNKENFGEIRNKKVLNYLTVQSSTEDSSFPKEKLMLPTRQKSKSLLISPSKFLLPINSLEEKFSNLKIHQLILKIRKVKKVINLFCYGIPTNLFENINLSKYFNYILTNNVDDADLIIINSSYFQDKKFVKRLEKKEKFIYVFNSINVKEITYLIRVMIYLILVKK